jgi:ankyrin repeat protein
VHSDGATALHSAAHYGDRRSVRKLIAASADVDAKDNGNG